MSREFVQRVMFRMSVLYPGSRRKIISETKKLIAVRTAISAVVFVILVLFDISLYWTAMAAVIVFIVNDTFEAYIYSGINIKLLAQFEEFLNDLLFQYRYCNNIEEALEETVMNSRFEMSMHGNLLVELISRDEYEETLEYYKSVCPNTYFLMFFSMCYMVRAEGDREYDGTSEFINNLNMLISDINDELNMCAKTDNAFSGLFMVTLLPIFMLKPMELWATGNVPELAKYYGSGAGVTGTLLISGLSVMIFVMIKKMKYPYNNTYQRKNRLLELLTYGTDENGRYARFISSIQNRLIGRSYSRYRKLAAYLGRTCSNINVREFKTKQFIYGVAGGILAVVFLTGISMPFFLRVSASIAGAAAGYFLPWFAMAFSFEIAKNNVANEVIRLQATVQMCRNQDGMDVPGILAHMEMVSVYFKNALAKATDGYDGNGIEALEELKTGEYNKLFLKMVDGLIACDVLPLTDAFANIEMERGFGIRKQKIEGEKILNNKSAVAKFAAFIPMMAAVAIKLILPFVTEGMNSIIQFSSEFRI